MKALAKFRTPLKDDQININKSEFLVEKIKTIEKLLHISNEKSLEIYILTKKKFFHEVFESKVKSLTFPPFTDLYF